MKRIKFIHTMGVGLVALCATGLNGCKKEEKAKPNITPPKTGDNNPPQEILLTDSAVIDGYLDKVSYSNSESIKIYINSDKNQDVKFGIYTPSGVLKGHVGAVLNKQLPGPDPYMNGFGYSLTCEYLIPNDLPSGLYFFAKKIPFIVKNKNKNGHVVVVLPSNTDNAYNRTGGLSSYTSPLSPILSFQRPYVLSSWSEGFWPWAEKLDYAIDYIADQDLDDYFNFSYAKVIIIPGHNEYWTKKARVNFDRFIDEGKNALILSGNTMWWQIRYSDDGTKMICYKNVKKDPINDLSLKTINWSESGLNYPIEKSIGVNFDLGGYGDGSYGKNKGWGGYKIVNENSPLLIGTNLKNGQLIRCLSQEYDGTFLKYEKGNQYPIIDNRLNFYKIELIGYDNGFRLKDTVGTFIAFKRTNTSGVIVNTSSTDWCSKRGIGGGDGDKIKQITLNAIDLLLSNGNVFSS